MVSRSHALKIVIALLQFNGDAQSLCCRGPNKYMHCILNAFSSLRPSWWLQMLVVTKGTSQATSLRKCFGVTSPPRVLAILVMTANIQMPLTLPPWRASAGFVPLCLCCCCDVFWKELGIVFHKGDLLSCLPGMAQVAEEIWQHGFFGGWCHCETQRRGRLFFS